MMSNYKASSWRRASWGRYLKRKNSAIAEQRELNGFLGSWSTVGHSWNILALTSFIVLPANTNFPEFAAKDFSLGEL